jgi:heme/copper-type cytochrome/quinol oxidase subunit 2
LLDFLQGVRQKYHAVAKYNLRFIFTVTVLVIVLLVSICLIGIAYEIAASHAIGRYAPIGEPTNFKHK